MIHCGDSRFMMASHSQVSCLSTHDKPRLMGVASHLFSRWYFCFMVICSKISVDITNDQRLDITYIFIYLRMIHTHLYIHMYFIYE